MEKRGTHKVAKPDYIFQFCYPLFHNQSCHQCCVDSGQETNPLASNQLDLPHTSSRLVIENSPGESGKLQGDPSGNEVCKAAVTDTSSSG